MKKSLAISLVAILILLAGSVTYATGAHVRETQRLADAARVRAAQLSGRSSVNLIVSDAGLLQFFEPMIEAVDESSGDEYWIERRSGQIWRYRNDAATDLDGRVDVGEARVLGQARRYFRRAVDSKRRASMVETVERVDRGESGNHYAIVYREHLDGIPTFNTLDMEFLPDGTLWRLIVQDEDVDVSMHPSISESQAIETLARESGLQRWADEDVQLVVERDPSGEQHLCWEVELITGDDAFGSMTQGFVDAHSGRLLVWGASTWGGDG